MPTKDDFFPSKYLRAADLKGKSICATIDCVAAEQFDNDGRKGVKPVIMFRDSKLKPLVCNRTNFSMIEKLHGGDTDSWAGKEIGLHAELVSFKGDVKESVRVIQPSQDFNDEISF